MECGHQALFTTFARVQVTSSGFKPPGKPVSESYTLPWSPDDSFYFRMGPVSKWTGSMPIQLFVDPSSSDLEACMWTENEKGQVMAGKKDEFSAILDPEIKATSNTAFVCAKVRTIVCQVCSMEDELKSNFAAELFAKPAAAHTWTAEPPRARAPFECPPYDELWEGRSRDLNSPPANSPAQMEDLWNVDGADQWPADEWPVMAEAGYEQWDEDKDEEDDYVPHWKKELAAQGYNPYATPPRSTTDWADRGQQPQARYGYEHPLNADW